MNPQVEAGQGRKYEFSQRCVQVAEKRNCMLSWPGSLLHDNRELVCYCLEMGPPVASTAGQWRPLSCWGARPGSFFRRSLAVVQATNGLGTGPPKGQRTRGTAKPQTADCKVLTLRVALQACGVKARPVFQAPGTRPAESHA